MAFALKPAGSIRRGLIRIVRRQLRRAETHVRGKHPSGVYEARKDVKKARAIVSLLREAEVPSLRKDVDRLREAGHVLGALRDADAMITTFDMLRSHFRRRLPEHTYAMLRRRLVTARARASQDARAGRTRSRVGRALRAVRANARDWRVPAIDGRDLAKLLKPGYRRSRKAMRRARGTMRPADLHRWRRRVKTLWYQLRLLEGRVPSLRRGIRDFKKLETWLGVDHNLTVLQLAIATDREIARRVPGAVGEIVAMCAVEQARLRKKAFAIGRRLLNPSNSVMYQM